MRDDQSMTIGTEMPLQLSAAAWQEWNRIVESILRGVAHALNNRAAALSAVIELAADGDGPESTSSILKAELQKVRDLSAVVRAIGTPRQGTEALAPRDAAADALAVLGMHADLRERATLIEAASNVAVRVPRWMLVRALVALVSSVPIGGAATHSLRITVSGDDEWVVVRAEGTSGRLAPRSALTSELARAMGGDVLDDAYGFRMPALAALRRREST
jgi:hypothetical protein